MFGSVPTHSPSGADEGVQARSREVVRVLRPRCAPPPSPDLRRFWLIRAVLLRTAAWMTHTHARRAACWTPNPRTTVASADGRSRSLGRDRDAARETPDVDEAEARYREALALAEELEMRPLQAHCHLGLGKLYRKSAASTRPAPSSPRPSRCSARWG